MAKKDEPETIIAALTLIADRIWWLALILFWVGVVLS